MLTRTSVFHWWSSRYGINPRIGGRPNFSRNSTGAFLSQEGEVDTAIVNTPRFDWLTLNLPNGLTERRKLFTLEMARTNNLVAASDFTDPAWAKTNCPVTPGRPDPGGGATACTLTSTAGNGQAAQTLSAGSSLVRRNSIWIRRRTGVGNIQMLSPDSLAFTTIPVTSDWTRPDLGAAANTLRAHGIRLVTSGDAVDVWLADNEDGSFSTSEIPTTTAPATRAADLMYWNYIQAPAAMMVYVRFVEGGTIAVTNGEILEFGSAAAGNPRFQINAPAGFYQVRYHDGTTANSSTLAAAPSIGDTVELVAILTPGAAVQIIQSINGAAVSAAALSATVTMAAAWADTRLWLNSISTIIGRGRFAEVKVVKYADVVAATSQGIMDEMRAFELGPNGDVL